MVTEKFPFASAFGMAILAPPGVSTERMTGPGEKDCPFTSKLCPLTIRNVGPPECPNNSPPLKISRVPRVGTAQVEFFGFTQSSSEGQHTLPHVCCEAGQHDLPFRQVPIQHLPLQHCSPKPQYALPQGVPTPHLPFWQIAGDSQQMSPQSA